MNNKPKILYFFTGQYPNKRGDYAFIHTEIEYTAQKFDKVVVIADCKKPDNDADIGQTPINVVTYWNEIKKLSVVNKFFYIVKIIFKSEFLAEIQELIANKKLNLKTTKTAIAFYANSLRIAKYVKQIQKKEGDASLYYSFWYHYATMASIHLIAKRRSSTGLAEVKPVSACTRTHGFDLYEHRNAMQYQPFKKFMDRRINKVFFISKQGLDYYKERFAQCVDDHYKLSYLGTLNSIVYNPNEYKIEKNVLRIVSCSNLVPVKRVHMIIETLENFSKSHGQVKVEWRHIGDGFLREELEILANDKLKTLSNVSYDFVGWLGNEDVLEYYKQHQFDLFISTTESEGLPVSMMEATSFGIPIIATNVGGISEIVGSDNGRLVAENAVSEDFSEALDWFFSLTDSARKVLRENSRNKWEANFNAERNYKQFANDLISLI